MFPGLNPYSPYTDPMHRYHNGSYRIYCTISTVDRDLYSPYTDPLHKYHNGSHRIYDHDHDLDRDLYSPYTDPAQHLIKAAIGYV